MRRNKIIHLTESEFARLVSEATKQTIKEYDGFTFGSVLKNTVSKEMVNGGPPESNKKLQVADNMKSSTAREIITVAVDNQYRDITFSFLGTSRTKIDEPFEFKLHSIEKQKQNTFALRGEITWDNTRFNGVVKYVHASGQCYCTSRRLGVYHYYLEPVPPTKHVWELLISSLID